MIHGLGDPGSTTGDHRVGAAVVMSHSDEVVDRRPGTGAGCRCWYTKGGSVKREAKVARGAGGAVCCTSWGAGAARRAATGSEVPAIEG
jgi:hypothetical protein